MKIKEMEFSLNKTWYCWTLIVLIACSCVLVLLFIGHYVKSVKASDMTLIQITENMTLESPLVLESNTVLEGIGDVTLSIVDYAGRSVVASTNTNNIIIRNLKLYAKPQTDVPFWGVLILLENVENVVVDNITGIAPNGGFSCHQAVQIRTSDNVTVSNSFVKDYYNVGFEAHSSTNVCFRDNEVLGGLSGYWVGPAYQFIASSSDMTDSTMINNRASGIVQQGIRGVIELTANGEGSVHGCSVLFNEIRDAPNSHGILQYNQLNWWTDNWTGRSFNNIITNNIIDNVGYNGIASFGSDNTTLENNIITNTGLKPITNYPPMYNPHREYYFPEPSPPPSGGGMAGGGGSAGWGNKRSTSIIGVSSDQGEIFEAIEIISMDVKFTMIIPNRTIIKSKSGGIIAAIRVEEYASENNTLSKIYEISPAGATFTANATISINYDGNDDVVLAQWDGTEWIPLHSTMEDNIVKTSINKLARFTLIKKPVSIVCLADNHKMIRQWLNSNYIGYYYYMITSGGYNIQPQHILIFLKGY